MKQPSKDKTPEMLNIGRDIRSIEDKVRTLQDRKRKLRQEWLDLREKSWGLVTGETMIREKPQGFAPSKPKVGVFRVGVFRHFYSKWHDSSSWVIVSLINKDGKVGLRKATFYDWEKME